MIESTKDTLCRNVTIYGHCRYEDKGCVFSHEQVKVTAPQPERYVALFQRNENEQSANSYSTACINVLTLIHPVFSLRLLLQTAAASCPSQQGCLQRLRVLHPSSPGEVRQVCCVVYAYPSDFDNSLAPTAPIFTPSIKRYNPIAPDWVNPDVPEVLPPYGNASAVRIFYIICSVVQFCIIPAHAMYALV